ncbi:MAG: bis(5'-nucleosyl)-tetraphosphatase (symmetrical) YqeK [Actinobacteria bacterium]|nr:bis(5'-nucleosyl)-tetraphosphatase (symmetrical) YqeK [Actinomycetota bacterium]
MDFINDLNIEKSKKQYLEQLIEKVKKLMKLPLFDHSINTLKFALQIVKKHREDVDIYSLGVSCILHDYGKIFNREQLAAIVKKHHPEVSSFELKLGSVLHALAGDFLVSRDFGITDEKILRSIRYHTTGYLGMSTGDKILLIADRAEEGRVYKDVKKIRELALEDINLCLIEVYKNTIIYVVNKGKPLHPDTSRVWNSISGGN